VSLSALAMLLIFYFLAVFLVICRKPFGVSRFARAFQRWLPDSALRLLRIVIPFVPRHRPMVTTFASALGHLCFLACWQDCPQFYSGTLKAIGSPCVPFKGSLQSLI